MTDQNPTQPPPAAGRGSMFAMVVLGLVLFTWFAMTKNGREFVSTSEGVVTSQPYYETLGGNAEVSIIRSLGVWVGGLMTLCIFSFLWRDNPAYKFAEAILVGVSAAYWIVQGFWTVFLPDLIAPLFPAATHALAPGFPTARADGAWLRLIPLALGLMLLMRLSPKGSWIARWPLALVIGTTAGLKLTVFTQADLIGQIRSTIQPILVTDSGQLDGVASLRAAIIVIATLSALTYFFFSAEHRGFVGVTSRVGIWVLMITFGAAFAYTVMGRIALLQARFEFLFDDWLWLIDPGGSRFL